VVVSAPGLIMWGIVGTHQSALGSVKSMPVVPPELGVGALERGVTVGLRLLDTALSSNQLLLSIVYRLLLAMEKMEASSTGW
jgi:hypothetical protein